MSRANDPVITHRFLQSQEWFKETLTAVNGLWYADKTIKLDGYWFHDCRFDNCVLTYDSLDFAIQACVFGQGTRVSHSYRGSRAVQLYHALPPDAADAWRFAPVRSGNRVTIDFHADPAVIDGQGTRDGS